MEMEREGSPYFESIRIVSDGSKNMAESINWHKKDTPMFSKDIPR